jgi:hypothetical protein
MVNAQNGANRFSLAIRSSHRARMPRVSGQSVPRLIVLTMQLFRSASALTRHPNALLVRSAGGFGLRRR